MSTALKWIALILSLGVDTLIMSISLGFVKAKANIAAVFACAEALMPLVGLCIGKGAGQLMGQWASLLGGIALLAIAVWLIFCEDEDEQAEKLKRNLMGWTLVVTALSISFDEFAVGFSIGLVGVPIAWTIAFIALQAFLFTFIGLTIGSKIKPFLGEWSEKLGGIVLGLLGIWITVDATLGLLSLEGANPP